SGASTGPVSTAFTDPIHVNDAALTAGAVTAPTASEGLAFTNQTLFHFTDANPNPDITDYSATIHWDDGSTDTVTSTASTVGQIVAGDGFDVQGSHTYSEEGSHFIYVTVADAGGSTTNSAPGLV